MARAPAILFIHDSFPAQFGGFGRWLAGRGWRVTFATAAAVDPAAAGPIEILPYAAHRPPAPQTHPYALATERAAINGQGFARAALGARRAGYRPDVILAHSGWGPGLFARDVFPEAAFVAYCEWWYRYPGADVAYLAAAEGRLPPASAEAAILERARNAPIALEMAGADAVICPTEFQAAQFPHPLRQAITVLHDGVDTARLRPDRAARASTLGGLLPEAARVVSYATRGMEPHRGFPQFMAALPRILAADPAAIAVIAGDNRVAYGGDALRRTDWKAKALAEHDLDPGRVRFIGRLAPPDYLRLLQRSDAHVYLSVPFVLSWSMLEAMSAGCPMVVSDTPPVLEFADARCARLADMRDPDAIAAAVADTLGDPGAAAARAADARARIVSRLRAPEIFARKADLLQELVQRRAPLGRPRRASSA